MSVEFDDGNKCDCIVLDIFDYNEKTYILLLPEGKKEYLVYRYLETEGSFELGNVDEEEFENVVRYIQSDDY